MKPLFGLAIVFTAGACLAADAYKWVDEKGIVNYGEKPPANRPASPVDTKPSGIVEGGSQFGQKPEPDKRGATEDRRPQTIALPVPAPGPAGVRGMEFDTYIRLQRGMTEGELLLRAGRPDHESVENLRHDIVKTYYYFPTVADPYTTAVTLRGGRIFNLERTKKF